MLDHYLWGNCDRISPEAPVGIINSHKESFSLGGCANVANNLSNIGCKISLFSVIGSDDDGINIKRLCKNSKIGINGLLIDNHRKTTRKSRVFAFHQNMLRIDKEDTFSINTNQENIILRKISKIIKNIDIVILSDYNKGVLTYNLTKKIIKLSNKNNKKVIADPKENNYLKFKNAFLITPNKSEAEKISKRKIKDKKDLLKVSKQLKKELNLNYCIITLSENGISYFKKSLKIIKVKSKEVFDVTGAGDTVIASIALSLANNKGVKESIICANFMASKAISKLGNYIISKDDINSFFNKDEISSNTELNDMLNIINNLKNKKIVFTNGCFDLLHIGHTRFLKSAKELGDILIIGLNSDLSIKSIKGKNRPINNQENRAELLLSLKYVDYVVIFNEDTPFNLIKAIRPDILVKGGDYNVKDIVGSSIAKKTKSLHYTKDKSTSLIINKIKNT
jgi:D-beta-D-heptose 7-phosphate kinase/D-beta-D-heptose 1-phosphate adenosyltransferase